MVHLPNGCDPKLEAHQHEPRRVQVSTSFTTFYRGVGRCFLNSTGLSLQEEWSQMIMCVLFTSLYCAFYHLLHHVPPLSPANMHLLVGPQIDVRRLHCDSHMGLPSSFLFVLLWGTPSIKGEMGSSEITLISKPFPMPKYWYKAWVQVSFPSDTQCYWVSITVWQSENIFIQM